MRLSVVASISGDNLSKRLKADKTKLDAQVAASIGDLAQGMGLSATSSFEQLARICAEVVSGWAIGIASDIMRKPSYANMGVDVAFHDGEGWARLAQIFALSFCFGNPIPPDAYAMEKLKMSFLQGVYLGLRRFTEKNVAIQSSVLMRQTLQKRANAVGLDPHAILQHEQALMRAQIAHQHSAHQRCFETASSQLLLQDEVEVIEDNEDEDDSMVYEFGDDGLVL